MPECGGDSVVPAHGYLLDGRPWVSVRNQAAPYPPDVCQGHRILGGRITPHPSCVGWQSLLLELAAGIDPGGGGLLVASETITSVSDCGANHAGLDMTDCLEQSPIINRSGIERGTGQHE